MPPRRQLTRIRDAIAEDPAPFTGIVTNRTRLRRFGPLSDEAALKRMPKGYPADHPAARWLRYQSFTIGRSLTDDQVTGKRLPALLETDFDHMLPLVRWLNRALGFRPATRR